MADITPALVRFAERLERAQATADGGLHGTIPTGSTPWRYAQQRWIKASQLFMEEIGLGRFIGLPLAMIEALGDLDRGNAEDGKLAPAPKDNRPPPTLESARVRARAIKIVDLMLQAPKAQRQTARVAAHKVWQAREDWSGIFDTPDQIVELRRNVLAGRASPDILRLWRMELPPEEFGITREDQIEALLALIPER